MARQFGRLTLENPVTLPDGTTSKEIVVLRPTAQQMIEMYIPDSPHAHLTYFIQNCCRAEVGSNGSGELKTFNSIDLYQADAAELSSVITALVQDSRAVAAKLVPDMADGVNDPIVYTLAFPLELRKRGPEGDEEIETVTQIEFVARKLGDLSEFLDAPWNQKFYVFMRVFGTLLGVNWPMSDSIIGSIDCVDYFVIRDSILGKLTAPRGRWKRVSTVQL